MANKKEVSRVSPPISVRPIGVDYAELGDGDAFIYGGRLYIKMEIFNQEGIGLSGGCQVLEDMCGKIVIPVDITIIWKEKK